MLVLPRLVNAYASSAGINPASIRLTTPEGDRMVRVGAVFSQFFHPRGPQNQQKDLAFYGVMDGDQLDVMIEQVGG